MDEHFQPVSAAGGVPRGAVCPLVCTRAVRPPVCPPVCPSARAGVGGGPRVGSGWAFCACCRSSPGGGEARGVCCRPGEPSPAAHAALPSQCLDGIDYDDFSFGSHMVEQKEPLMETGKGCVPLGGSQQRPRVPPSPVWAGWDPSPALQSGAVPPGPAAPHLLGLTGASSLCPPAVGPYLVIIEQPKQVRVALGREQAELSPPRGAFPVLPSG